MSTKTAQQQLKFCKDVVKELFKKVHESYAFAFYNPVGAFCLFRSSRAGAHRFVVDYIALNIPNYPDVVRRPMDLTTVRTKLDQGVYPIPPYDAFEQDVRLIFSNCYLFNPPNTTVHDWGRQLEGVFEDKWASRPMGDDEDDDCAYWSRSLAEPLLTMRSLQSRTTTEESVSFSSKSIRFKTRFR